MYSCPFFNRNFVQVFTNFFHYSNVLGMDRKCHQRINQDRICLKSRSEKPTGETRSTFWWRFIRHTDTRLLSHLYRYPFIGLSIQMPAYSSAVTRSWGHLCRYPFIEPYVRILAYWAICTATRSLGHLYRYTLIEPSVQIPAYWAICNDTCSSGHLYRYPLIEPSEQIPAY